MIKLVSAVLGVAVALIAVAGHRAIDQEVRGVMTDWVPYGVVGWPPIRNR